MKVTILISLLLFSVRGFGYCLPDSLSIESVDEDISEFELVAYDFQKVVAPTLDRDQNLIVQLQMLNSRVNAEIKKDNNLLMIEVMGGMVNHPQMNINAFKLLLCHEWGHFMGGAPFKSRGGWSSTEGQADYYSGSVCSRLLGMDETSFLNGALALTQIYAIVTREAPPKLDQCDMSRVQRINFGYPSVQCRLDTIIAGWRKKPRPACWYID